MRKAVLTVAVFLAVPAAGAFAQEDMERRAAELKKWYEGARREAEEQFRATMQKLERAFEEKMDAIKREGAEKRDVEKKRMPDKFPPKDVPQKEFRKDAPPPKGEGIERMMDELFRAVKRLEGQLQDLREDMDRMRRGGGDRERGFEPPRPPKAPAPPREREREMEREKFEFKFDREMPERFRKFGEEFREMFREKKFDWERFGDRFPKEFHEFGPDGMFRFFKEHGDWFPKDADRERWFDEFHKWMQKRHHGDEEKRFEEKKVEKKKVEKKHKDENEDDERREY
jgi:hypothetical protein